jgi:hypothetical protein
METYILIDKGNFDLVSPIFGTVKDVVDWANENMIYYWTDFYQIAIVEELRQHGIIK